MALGANRGRNDDRRWLRDDVAQGQPVNRPVLADWLDALALGANRDRNDDMRQLRNDVAQGQPVNRPVLAHHHRQLVYSDESEEGDEFVFANHRPARGGGR